MWRCGDVEMGVCRYVDMWMCGNGGWVGRELTARYCRAMNGILVLGRTALMMFSTIEQLVEKG